MVATNVGEVVGRWVDEMDAEFAVQPHTSFRTRVGGQEEDVAAFVVGSMLAVHLKGREGGERNDGGPRLALASSPHSPSGCHRRTRQ